MRRYLLLVLVGAVASLNASALLAQEDEPETRVITVTTFHVPFGEAFGEALDFIDTYFVPGANENPHILGFRYATHAWGNTAANVWLMTEYASLAAIEEAEAWGNARFEEHFPEGTPEREEADRAFEEDFAPYFSKHKDNILTVSMDRAK
jgi:hypothetical protein